MALPNTYDRLDYIQSDGNQYIKTGLIPNAIGRVKTSVTFTTSGRQLFLCSWGSGTNKAYFIERTTSNNYNFECTGVTKSASTTTALTTNNKYEIDVDLVNNSILINDNKMCTTSGFTTATRELYLFASNDADEGVFVKCSTKLDYLEVYDKNGTLIRNFIPAIRKSDSVVGLYDETNEVFYTNNGSGSFTYGSILYEVSAEVNPNGSGVVVGQDIYPSGSSATLEAIANDGYIFENWEFSEDKHNILESTCTTTPSFTTNSWSGWASWVSSYGPGTNNNYVTFKFDEPIVITSYACSNHNDTNSTTWDFTIAGSNDGVNYTNIQTDSFPARAYKTVSVNNNTAYKYYRLIYSRYNNTYEDGRYTLRNLSFTGYRIGTNNDNPYNFVVYGNTNLIANFKLNYQITLVYDSTLGNATYDWVSGTQIQLVATPNSNAQFKGYYINSIPISTNATYTYTVLSDVVIEARFEDIYEITTNCIGNGNITYTRGGTDKNLVTFTATPYLISRFIKFIYNYTIIVDKGTLTSNEDKIITQDNNYLMVSTQEDRSTEYEESPLTIRLYSDVTLIAYFEDVFECIYDRVQPDVDRVKELNKKLQKDNYTQDELAEWRTEMKGSLNLSDLVRIRNNTKYLALRLGVSITAQDNIPEIPTKEFYTIMLNNVIAVREAWMVYADTPALPTPPLNYYPKWNIIEKTLWDIYSILEASMWYHTGIDLIAGDNILI